MSIAVIGAQFGDEGKGSVTDFLVNRYNINNVIRFSGGQQAGHTVMKKDIKHTFSNFGSGTLSGAKTYWSKYCSLYPIYLVEEFKSLLSKNIKPELFVDKNCPITTIYDVYYNKNNNKYTNNGTCGLGVGATFERESNFYSLLFEDIFYDSILETKLNLIEKYYSEKINSDVKLFNDDFFEAIDFIKKNVTVVDTYKYSNDNINAIYEGSQGLMLDQNIGFFPHVTRANTGTKNIKNNITEVYYVTRAYQTRHGNGPMLNESINYNIKNNPFEINVLNQNQGEFRKSMLNLDLLKYAIDKDNFYNKNLVITCLDNLSDYHFIQNNQIIKCNSKEEFIYKISQITKFKNILISESPYSDNISYFKNI